MRSTLLRVHTTIQTMEYGVCPVLTSPLTLTPLHMPLQPHRPPPAPQLGPTSSEVRVFALAIPSVWHMLPLEIHVLSLYFI